MHALSSHFNRPYGAGLALAESPGVETPGYSRTSLRDVDFDPRECEKSAADLFSDG
jgi:hypothetical protein